MKHNSKIIYLLFILFLFSACAKQNAGIVKQTYHDLTSHYNGYFNANESFNLHLKSLKKNRKENYDEILPIFAYGKIEDTKDNGGGALTESIEKARLTIQTHQEKEKGKNYLAYEDNSISNWSDDAFVLIGKSYYMEGQLDSAISCFRYVTANFDVAVDGRSKKKIKKQKSNKKLKAKANKLEDKLLAKEIKGKDVRPKKKLGLHEAAKSEALVWLVKSYISNKQFVEADAILTYIRSDKTFLKNYDKEVELTNSYLFLAQGNHKASIPFVEASIAKTKKQKNKARLQFILAQLYESQLDKNTAATYYKQSIKANENFEMVFYAKLKMIQMNRGNSGLSKETEKLIARMTKDNKNRNYFDQLYYEKALIALDDQDREAAKKYLEKSIKLSTTNTNQKGISFIKLAEMNYDEEVYTLAQAYYDSALNFIEPSYIFYDEANNRSVVLSELINSLSTIKVNDSLLVLAEIPAKELEALLYKKAVDLVDDEIKLEDRNKQSNLIASSASNEKSDKNSWYFYSEASRSSGYKKFKQIWGEIELGDDWRRSDKSDEFNADTESDANTKDEYFTRIDSKYEEMLNAVPNTDKAKTQLKTDIIDGYYNAALIYKVGLNNLPKSVEMFETLNKRYPGNSHEPEALYQLYLIHLDLDNKGKSDLAKNELLTKYPDHKFSDFIKNPSKLDDLSHKKGAELLYNKAYEAYLIENFEDAILKCEEANKLYANDPLLAKFDLLKAMSIGGQKLYEPFISSLEYVVANHKSTEEQARAEELLAYLRGEDEKEATKPQIKNDKLIDGKRIDGGVIKGKTDLNDGDSDSNPGGVMLKLGNKEINIGGKKGDKPAAEEGE